MRSAVKMPLRSLRNWSFVVLLASGGVAYGADPRREVRFPDVPGYHTLKCDFHMHTVFSDGDVWPATRVEEAWREGLDAIAITDHIEYRPHKDDFRGANLNRSYEIAMEPARQRNILLVRGVEITRDTPPGHFNALFLRDVNPLNTKDFYKVFEAAAEQHAFVFWNHPGWQGPERGRWGEAQTTLFEKKQMHGIEICNGDVYYPDAHRWAMEKNLVMTGNTDIHDPSIDANRTAENHRTMTLVFAKDKTLDSLRAALDAGRTAVWCRNQVIGREEPLAALFAACVRVGPVHHRTKDHAWLEMRNLSELDIELEPEGKMPTGKLTLRAGTTSLVQLKGAAGDKNKELAYRAVNFLVAPDTTLKVKLTIPD